MKQDIVSLSLKSKSFTPSYKKASSYSDPPDKLNCIDISTSPASKLVEIDIE